MKTGVARLIPVPAKFYDDHAGRALPTPVEVRRAGNRVFIRADDPDLDELREDAKFYADRWGPDELPPGLKASAKRTVAALTQTDKSQSRSQP